MSKYIILLIQKDKHIILDGHKLILKNNLPTIYKGKKKKKSQGRAIAHWAHVALPLPAVRLPKSSEEGI